jgi:hypothetical protein
MSRSPSMCAVMVRCKLCVSLMQTILMQSSLKATDAGDLARPLIASCSSRDRKDSQTPGNRSELPYETAACLSTLSEACRKPGKPLGPSYRCKGARDTGAPTRSWGNGRPGHTEPSARERQCHNSSSARSSAFTLAPWLLDSIARP